MDDFNQIVEVLKSMMYRSDCAEELLQVAPKQLTKFQDKARCQPILECEDIPDGVVIFFKKFGVEITFKQVGPKEEVKNGETRTS